MGSPLVTTLHPGGKSAWAMMSPIIERSGSAAGRQSIRTSGDCVAPTSVQVTGATAAQVAMALRTAVNSPSVSAVPSPKAKVSCGVGHAHRLTKAMPLSRSAMPQRGIDMSARVASSKMPVAGRP